MEQKEDTEVIWKRWLFSTAPGYKDPKNDGNTFTCTTLLTN